MKKHIADLLSLARLVLSIIGGIAIVHGQWSFAIGLFIAAAMTDAFDGIAARRWPYPQGEEHWWRYNPEWNDHLADGVLTFSALGGVSYVFPGWRIATFALLAFTVVFLYAVSRIRKHNKVLAEWLVVAQGWGNGIVVGSLTLTMMINATPHWPMFVAALGVTVAIFAYIKRDRLFARPEMRE